jgi:hypothetical protein
MRANIHSVETIDRPPHVERQALQSSSYLKHEEADPDAAVRCRWVLTSCFKNLHVCIAVAANRKLRLQLLTYLASAQLAYSKFRTSFCLATFIRSEACAFSHQSGYQCWYNTLMAMLS